MDMRQALSIDTRATEQLRATAARDPQAALEQAAQQFEALFMQEMLKSMRAATDTMKSGMLDNSGSDLATGMLDTQLATGLTGAQGGLGEMIARQLAGAMGIGRAGDAGDGGLGQPITPGVLNTTRWVPPTAGTRHERAAGPVRTAVGGLDTPPVGDGPQASFLRQHWDAARAAESASGIPASFILAQAAHESGWGRHEIKENGQRNSHNLFGIKATGGWRGDVAEITTTEVIDGVAHKVKAKFRSYESYEQAFLDYARLLSNSPRYASVIENARSARGFAQGLQDAGYATDPQYAEKLQRVINTTLRLQRTSG